MARGLFWLPLLGIFIWLAYSGWKEYKKVEYYQTWAENFEKAKYDLYAVLGKKEREITWGKPTSKGIIDIQKFSLDNVLSIELILENKAIDLNNIPENNKVEKPVLKFSLKEKLQSIEIPFTEIELAAKWTKYLNSELKENKID